MKKERREEKYRQAATATRGWRRREEEREREGGRAEANGRAVNEKMISAVNVE